MRLTLVVLTAAAFLAPEHASAFQAQPGPPKAATPARTPTPTPSRAARTSAIQPAIVPVGETDWRFADPQAALIGGLNLDSLAHSELLHNVLQEIIAKLGQSPDVLTKLVGDSAISRLSFSVSDRHG